MADWTPERVVHTALARRLLGEARPDLAHLPVAPLGEGFDNTCFLAGHDLVLRFPRRAVALPLLDTERRLLGAIAAAVPVVVPEVRFVAEPTEAFGWPWLGVRHVAGHTLDQVDTPLDPTQLGAFLRSLHATRIDAPVDTWHRADPDHRAQRAAQWLHELHALGASPPPSAFDLDARPWPTTLVTCHGDVYARHLVVDDRGSLVGVIDWGDCHHGDRTKDLAGAWVTLPPEHHAAFLDAYGRVEPAEWCGARLLATAHSAAVVRYGLARPDAHMLHIGQRALRWIASAT